MVREEKEQPTEFLSGKSVFYVGSETDDTVLVAINPTFNKNTQTLTWWDTTKERMKMVDTWEIDEENLSLKITDKQSTDYIFVPLNMQLYDNLVKNKVRNGKNFSTEEEMLQAFKETLI